VQRVEPDSARAILEIAHDAFVTLDSEGCVLDWNPRAEELFGYSREEALGSEAAQLIVPERYRERHRAGVREAGRSGSGPMLGRRMHVQALGAGGREFPVDVTATADRHDDRWLLHAWIEDMSERTALLHELEAQLRGGRPGFAEIFDVLAEAVTIRDRNDHIVFANRAAVEQMGFASLEELQRRPPRSIMDDYLVQDEHGAELTMQDIPSVRLLGGGEAEPLVMRTIHRASGVVHWELLKSTALHDENGETFAAVTVIEDITREKTSELRERFLARASETLMSSLDYEETLRNVAWLAVPEIADWCAVDLVEAGRSRQQVVVAHRDPSKLALAEQLRRFAPPEPRPEQGITRVLRTGVAELYPDIADEMLVGLATSDEHLRLLRAVGFRSALLVPLRSGTRTLGVITLVNADSLRRFDEADKEFAQQIAGRASVAVDNARLATSRREIAHTLQRSLLPEVVPPIDGWEAATLHRPGSAAEEVEVGGDFYDFLPTESGWIVLIGDVTGKGIEAAAMTSLVRHGALFLSRYEDSPSRILAGLNEALRERPGLWLCTALCVRLQPERLVIGSAGHPPPLIVRDDGRIREIGGAGPILGAWAGEQSPDRSVPISGDETLLLYTDGVIDTRGESERFGTRRLARLLALHAGKPPAELLAELQLALDRFQAARPSDDTAAVALRAGPATSPARGHIAQPGTGVRSLRTI
jgi:PAS domain S-box-containing protein